MSQQGITNITAVDFSKIQSLMARFNRLEKNLVDIKIEYEIPRYRSLVKNFSLAHNIALKLIENEAPKFNLFNIISIGHLEAKVHTPFLAELLNPDGTHRQGRLFFDAFMRLLFNESFHSEIIQNISIKIELSDYENGRMDIVIFYTEQGTPKSVVVENKIYHHDEPNQLIRYHTYLTKTLNLIPGQYHLVYLTPHKQKPSSASISDELYNKLKQAGSISELGYYSDIAPMLHATLAHIKAPVVKETLHQYIESIKTL